MPRFCHLQAKLRNRHIFLFFAVILQPCFRQPAKRMHYFLVTAPILTAVYWLFHRVIPFFYFAICVCSHHFSLPFSPGFLPPAPYKNQVHNTYFNTKKAFAACSRQRPFSRFLAFTDSRQTTAAALLSPAGHG